MLYFVLLISLAISSCFALPTKNDANATTCYNYVLISARGTFEPQGPSIGFVGTISETLSSIPNGIEYDVVYPAELTQLGAIEGSKDILRFVQVSHKACPQQKYILMGYSQGATAVLMALSKLAKLPEEDAIKGIVLIGNPYQKKNQAYTIDENGGSGTRGRNGLFLLLNLPLGDVLKPWERKGKIQNICYTHDIVCNGLGGGTDALSHLQYGFSDAQELMAEFIGSKLQV